MSDLPPKVVHVWVPGTGTLCGLVRFEPGNTPWPDGHKMVVLTELPRRHPHVTCEKCSRLTEHFSGKPGIGTPDGQSGALTSDDPPKVTSEEPHVIRMRGLFANEGPALLRALFGWRAQGKLERWKTVPSRALASLADRLAVEYPDTTRSLREAGERDAANAAEAAGGKVHPTDLPKGTSAGLPAMMVECSCGVTFTPMRCPGCETEHPPIVMAQRPMLWNAAAGTYRQVEPEEWTDSPPYARTAALLRQLRAERDRSTIPAALAPLRQALDAALDAFEAEDLEQ